MSRVVDHAERRREIARAAMTVVAAEGPDRLTLRRVAAETGQTTGAITHYFEDREALLLAALEAADSGIRERLPAAVHDRDALVDAALALLPDDEHSRACWKTWMAFGGRVQRSPRLLREARQQEHGWLAQARVVLGTAGFDGDDDALEAEAELLLTVIDGLGYHMSSDPKHWTRARARRVLETYVAHRPPSRTTKER